MLIVASRFSSLPVHSRKTRGLHGPPSDDVTVRVSINCNAPKIRVDIMANHNFFKWHQVGPASRHNLPPLNNCREGIHHITKTKACPGYGDPKQDNERALIFSQ